MKLETEHLLASKDRKRQTASGKSSAAEERSSPRFPLPWSHYVRLLSVKSEEARGFYEIEALRGGWSVRQLDRQITTQFYERTALSRNRAALMRKGQRTLPEDRLTAEEEIKDPMVLEFLGLKDEYSESALEDALIHRLEQFLLELGKDFAFIARQKRLRVGDEWYRVDLMFFHRRLRCLVIIDLKIGKFTHSDAGQMNLYLNYAREHWTLADENPPIGLVLSSEKNEAVAHYALGYLRNKVLSSEYKLALPDEKRLAEEMARALHLFFIEGSKFHQFPCVSCDGIGSSSCDCSDSRIHSLTVLRIPFRVEKCEWALHPTNARCPFPPFGAGIEHVLSACPKLPQPGISEVMKR